MTFPKLKPGQSPTAAEWNALVEFVQGMLLPGGQPTGEIALSRGLGGLQVNDARERTHWAKITGTDGAGNYSHESVAPKSDGTWVSLGTGSAALGPWGTTTSAPARDVGSRLDVPVDGTVVVKLWPDNTIPGFRFRYDGTILTTSGPYHAVLTEATGAATWMKRRVDSGGAWADTGSLQGNSAYPIELEGGSFLVKPTAKVVLWPDPVTGSYYDLLPVQSAHLVSGTYYAGYVIDGAQTWRGTKTFHHAVVIDPEGGNGPSLTMGGTLANPASITVSQGAYLFGLYDNTFPTIGTFRVRWDSGACLGEYVEINQGSFGGRTNIYLHTLVGGTCSLTCANSGQLDSLTGFGVGGGTYIGQTYTANFGGMTLDFNGGILIAHSGSFTAGTVTSTSGGTTGITFTSPTTTPTMTGTLVVANGGTGLATVTTNGVLYGNGTGALGVTSAPTSGQLLIGGSAPDFKTMSGDATITSAGVLTIGNAKVTLAKIANAAANSKLVGSGASGSGSAYVEITLGSGLTMTGSTLSASGGSPGGSSGDLQYNNAGAFGGVTGLTTLGATAILQASNGTVEARLVQGTTIAAEFHDAARTVDLCDGTYAVNVIVGLVRTLGTSGNTYRVDAGTTAPSTNAGTPTTRYGGDTNYCGDPDAWILVNIGGTDYKIPAFL